MAHSISLTLEAPPIDRNVHPSLLPPFGLQRRSMSQYSRNRKSSNTLPSRSKNSTRKPSTLRRQADVIRYAGSKRSEESLYDRNQIEMQQRVYFHNVFTPGVHSTPLYGHRNQSHNLTKETSSSSLNNINNNMQIQQPLPNFYINDYELFKSSTNSNISNSNSVGSAVPTISSKIDNADRRSTASTERVESKIVKKRGICGVSWVLRLAFKDSNVSKVYRKQIGWIVLILIIFILVGFALVPFSSHFSSYHFIKFTNFSQVPPKIISRENITMEVVLNTTTAALITTTTQEPMYSEDANRTIYPVTEDLPTVVLIPDTKLDEKNKTSNKKSNLKTEYIAWKESNERRDNLTNELMGFCRGCRKDLDICIAVSDTGIPVCRPARDVNDPTGCGGLCALEIEACHLLNQKYFIYTCRPLETLQPCEQDEWRCANLLCIPESKRCDGRINCYDRSDETDCFCDLSTNFQCGNNTSCLSPSKRCDGVVDCWDGSDELNCTQACPNEQFTCNNGECIQSNLFCDGLADCADKSDEPSGCGGVCRKHEFKCTNKRCIAKTKVCNGTDNCGDMSDEMNCPSVKTS